MILPILSSLVLSSTPAVGPAAVLPPAVLQDEEVAKRIAEAGDDVAKLLELAETLKSEDNRNGAREAFRRVLEIDSENEIAHKGLRHHFYDGKWFTSYAKLSKYRREEAKRMKEEHGLVRFNDEWVPEVDVPFLRMGWVKEGEIWVNPRLVNEQKKVAELQEAGFRLRKDDMSWIAPDEVEKWNQVLWKCGEDWLTTEEANEYHAKIGQWWKLGGDYFEVWSTCTWDFANHARWQVDLLYPELVKIFGAQPSPSDPPVVVVLNSLEQYNAFAGGSQEAQIQPAEAEGFSSIHHTFFADVFFDVSEQPPLYLGSGVGYWEPEGTANAWGPHSVRHAATQSYCEKIDPSWMTISEMMANQGGGPALDQFWKEKQIPRWLRYGAGSYLERYANDQVLGLGQNGYAVRDWAFEELRKKGMRPLSEILEFGLTLDDIEGSSNMIHEAGAVVAYVMQGANGEVRQAHGAFKNALRKGEGAKEAAAELEKVLLENEKGLREFLGV